MTAEKSSVVTVVLDDLDADRRLLDFGGVSLLVFTSEGCSSCRWAAQKLPQMNLPIERIVWLDATRSGGLVQRYEVFHLPSLFVVADGQFYGELRCQLEESALRAGLKQALVRMSDELP